MRCRRQKIKCTEGRPCAPCTRRKLPCKSDERAQSVLVNRELVDHAFQPCFQTEHVAGQPLSRYLLYLEEAVASLKQIQGGAQPPRETASQRAAHPTADSIRVAGTAENELDESSNLAQTYASTSQEESEASGWNSLTNPLSTGQSVFMTTDSGRKCASG